MPKASKKMQIIGTGLSGLVGSRIVELLGNKYSFYNLDLSSGIDITRENDVKIEIEKASGEVVIHLAAFTGVDIAHQQNNNKNGLCYKLNVLGTRYVAQYCSKYHKYLIHISTDFVFDGKKTNSYTENDVPNPIEWYGKTKYWAEREVAKAGGKHAIVRIAYPFRAKHQAKKDFIRQLMEKLNIGSLHPMFSDQIITPTFIDDISQALDIFIQKRPQGIYHMVGSSSLSPYDIAIKVANKFGFNEKIIKKGSLEEFLKTAKRPYHKCLKISNKKIKQELGIEMKTFDKALNYLEKQMSNKEGLCSNI